MPFHQRASWRIRLFSGLLTLALIATMVVWVSDAFARVKRSGAGGCGDFLAAAQTAEDGDVLIPMVDEGLGRSSGNATITADVLIEGGWSPPVTNCPPDDTVLDTPKALLDAGFSYGGAASRARLHNRLDSPAPVVTLDAQVKSFHSLAMIFEVGQTFSGNGGGIAGTGLTGADLLFDQVSFEEDPNNTGLELQGNGGGLYLEVTGGSHVTLRDVQFTNLAALNGGGFEIVVRGGSHLTIDRATVSGNQAVGFGADGRGGGGRIILESGYVTITNSLFQNNSAVNAGGALLIRRPNGATGPAQVWLSNNRFSGNTAVTGANIHTEGNGLIIRTLSPAAFLPQVTAIQPPSAAITSISRNGTTYTIIFETYGFTPAMGQYHIHFFADTVVWSEAGYPGLGPWKSAFSGDPFTSFTVADRPFGATQVCILVASPEHSPLSYGNCADLP